jgi:hypothetical protein
VAVLAGINPMANFLQGQADFFSTLGLPQWLVQWVSGSGGIHRPSHTHHAA